MKENIIKILLAAVCFTAAVYILAVAACLKMRYEDELLD